VKEETRQWGIDQTTGKRTEALTVYTPGSGKTDLTVNNTFNTYNWGEQMVTTSLGSSNPTTTSTAFYTAIPQQATRCPNRFSTGTPTGTGTWTGFDYNTSSTDARWFCTVSHQYRPFNNSPTTPTSFSTTQGEVTAFGFTTDFFGVPNRPASVQTQINGVTTSQSSTTYVNGTAPTVPAMALVTATETIATPAPGASPRSRSTSGKT